MISHEVRELTISFYIPNKSTVSVLCPEPKVLLCTFQSKASEWMLLGSIQFIHLIKKNFYSLGKFNSHPWHSLYVLVRMRMNSWAILLTLLTVLSCFSQPPPSRFFQTVPSWLCLATVWHVSLHYLSSQLFFSFMLWIVLCIKLKHGSALPEA